MHSIVVSIIMPLVTGAHFDLPRQHRRRTRDPIHSIGIANACDRVLTCLSLCFPSKSLLDSRATRWPNV